jgi:hypothetical protein
MSLIDTIKAHGFEVVCTALFMGAILLLTAQVPTRSEWRQTQFENMIAACSERWPDRDIIVTKNALVCLVQVSPNLGFVPESNVMIKIQ